MKGSTDKKRLRLFAAAAIALLLVGLLFGAFMLFESDTLVISEICAVNDGEHEAAALLDSEGKLCDWVELYNPTKHNIRLDKFSLIRGGEDECAISGGTIPPGGYALVYCTKNGFEDSSVSFVDFKIPKAESCTITLMRRGKEIDSLTAEPTIKGRSVCAGDEGAYISVPTPCAANSDTMFASQIVFSRESGFYNDEFTLELAAEHSESIYYTLDGTDPRTSDTAKIYSAPITVKDRAGDPNLLSAVDPMTIQLDYREGKVEAPKDEDVDKGTVIRACGKDPNGEWGLVGTATYFVGLSTADHSELPVLSLVTSPEALYDHETGIYVRGKVYDEYYANHPDHYYNGSIPANYNQRGRKWERECTIQFFESDGSLQFTQDAGMRIQGGWSRADYQKSFRFYARSDYGKDSFDQRFWDGLACADGENAESFSTFVLRNGGNAANFLKYKDIMMQDMAKGLNVPTQTGRACVLFIDGEYWGHYVLQEDYSQEYFKKHYGVSENSVAVYKNDVLENGLTVDELSYNNMLSFIVGNDMSKEENYLRAGELLDMDNFIDYCAVEMYIFNDDWPQNNYGCWRSTDGSAYGDGKWRYFLFDTESCAYHYNTDNSTVSCYKYLENKGGYPLAKMILSLLENDEFRQRLLTRLMDMGNIVYESSRVKSLEKEYQEDYFPEMNAYYLRFNTYRSVDSSLTPMSDRMTRFFGERQTKLISYTREYYDLGAPKNVTILGEALTLNGLDIKSDFTGKYFNNSELTLTANPEDGNTVRWQVESGGKLTEYDGSVLTLKVSGDTKITAICE